MAEAYEVNASGLRLRDQPVDGVIISVLPTGHTVDKLGKADVDGWWRVSTRVGSMMEEGYVSAEWLAPLDPKPAFRLPFLKDLRASFDRVKSFVGDIAERYRPEDLPNFNSVLSEYGINKNAKRFTHFLAQIAHESGRFQRLDENLNYSADGLWNVFRKYFESPEQAADFARQPERIANRVYANRMGNGDEATGDGWRYRGRGFIQLTGKDNYRRIGEALGLDLVNDPDVVATNPEVALRVAAAYWKDRDLNKLADRGDIDAITRKINGGLNGIDDRKRYLAKARAIWG